MKDFKFIAFDSSGKKKLDTVRAWSLSEAKRKIQQRGFYLASIKIQDSSVGSGNTSTKVKDTVGNRKDSCIKGNK